MGMAAGRTLSLALASWRPWRRVTFCVTRSGVFLKRCSVLSGCNPPLNSRGTAPLDTVSTPAPLPASRPRKNSTVYECGDCGTRLLGAQRCDCGTFMHRIGTGGLCPSCDEPVAIEELLQP